MLVSKVPVVLTRFPRMSEMPTPRKLDNRISAILASEFATAELFDSGAEWYSAHAPIAMAQIADDTGLEYRTVAGMLAAMSAGYSWPDSLRHIYIIAAGSRDGIAAPYGWRSISEAEAIRDGADPDIILRNVKGDTDTVKRWNFFHNLMGDFAKVTIDVHMARGLTGGFLNGTPPAKRYGILADAIKRAADKHGFEPAEMQAILWTIVRGEAH